MVAIGRIASYVLISVFILSLLGLFRLGFTVGGNLYTLALILQIWFNFNANKLRSKSAVALHPDVLDFEEDEAEIRIPIVMRITGWIVNIMYIINIVVFGSLIFDPSANFRFNQYGVILMVMLALILLTIFYNHRTMHPKSKKVYD